MSELAWRKSSFSGDDASRDCVEVAVARDGQIHFRESDTPDVVAVTTPARWGAFVKGVKAGEFDERLTS
ncbi:DUF397 domain-containing protein [Actinacidiphila oryziradicis]|uniref:DUF397 domain-containing protein n=1 Tax=Actinacidiphila oryziradicis TaxID=2571141 RepID=A0A4U0SRI8_9ACTN|nr:DUF397 domain-containing protein [Actinacidiphila oryziradicis]TKA03005.1 DUF397 domain-containing protein [Actinacidiphila oryziradicis]